MPLVDPHYLWAFGHGVMLLGAGYIMLQTVFFRPTPAKTYRVSYLGALLSYAIVVTKSLGMPSLNQAWLRRAFVDENVQYMVLALYWFISKPINLTIVPFATFSLFHCLTFLRTNIIPKFVPRQPATPAGQQAPPPAMLQSVSNKIQLWVKGNYDPAMRFVAFTELAILARVTIGTLTWTGSFLAPLFLAHFIRLRYHASPFTRQAVNTVTAKIDQFALPRGGAIANGWNFVKRMVGQWGGGKLVPQQPVPGRAGAGAGAAGGAGANAQNRAR